MQTSVTIQTDTVKPLAHQPWMEDFLAAKGFLQISSEAFSNGNATLRFDGTKFNASADSGEKVWTSDFGNARTETIKLMIEQILKLRPFLSEAQIEDERLRKEKIETALAGIANAIADNPESDPGIQLRRFLWSLYNGHHLINLWQMIVALDSERLGSVSEIFSGASSGVLKEDGIKRALCIAGEFERSEHVIPSAKHIAKMKEAESAIDALLHTLAPSRAHEEIKCARESLWQARDAIGRA